MADKRLDQTTNASAVAAADNIPFVTAAGVTSYVTGDELAASGPFSSRYRPLAETIALSGSALRNGFGAATFGHWINANYGAWSLDADVQEILTGLTFIPAHWNSYHVDVIWSQDFNGSGDVYWDYKRCAAGDGDTVAANTVAGVTVAAPNNDVVKVTRLETSSTQAIGEPLLISIGRRGDLAGDTLPNDCLLLGLLFTRAS